jgi:hypothetical protein
MKWTEKIKANDAFRFYRYFKKHPKSSILKQNGGLSKLLKTLCSEKIKSYISLLSMSSPVSDTCQKVLDKGFNEIVNVDVIPDVKEVQPVVKPSDLSGRLLMGHGETLAEKFTVPHDTYIIYNTILGESGLSTKSELNFMSLLSGPMWRELLYLLTFDFRDKYLGGIKYFSRRMIFTPHSYCNDSLIEIPSYEIVDCFNYYKKMKDPDVIYDFKKPSEQLGHYVYHGLFELPLELPDITKKEEDIFFLYKNDAGKEVRVSRISDVPQGKISTSKVKNKIYRSREGRVISVYDPVRQRFLDSLWSFRVLSDDKMYRCDAKLSEFNKRGENGKSRFKIIEDYKPGCTGEDCEIINLSKLVQAMREELDQTEDGKKQKLVVVTPVCRGYETLKENNVKMCVNVENTMVQLLSKLELPPDQIKIMEECRDRLELLLTEGLEGMKQSMVNSSSSMNIVQPGLLKRKSPNNKTNTNANTYLKRQRAENKSFMNQ